MINILDLAKKIFHNENNLTSQLTFEAHEKKFRGQCKLIMEIFLNGQSLTVAEAMIRYNIGDLRRRIKDLKDNYKVKGIISKTHAKSGKKTWWLDINEYKKSLKN